jgi:MFS family permease
MSTLGSWEHGLWRWLFLEIYLPSIISAIARGMLSISIPLYLIARGSDPLYVGIGSAAIAIGNLVMDIPGGIVLGSFGERILMRISMIVLAASSTAMALLDSPLAIVILSIAFGGGRSLWLLSRRYVVTYYVPYSYRGRASSFIGMSERIGSFAGPGIMALVVGDLGYRFIFLLCSLLTIASLIPNMLSSGRGYSEYGDRPPAHDVRAISTISPRIDAWFISLAIVSNIAIQGVRSSRNILLALIGKSIELGDSSVGFAASISGLLDVVSSYPAGVLMDKKGRGVTVAISFSIMSIGYSLLTFSRSDYLFYISTSIIGLGNGFGSGALITMGADIGSRMRGSRGAFFLASWQFIGDLGSALFPIAVGAMASAYGLVITPLSISLISASIPAIFRRTIRRAGI